MYWSASLTDAVGGAIKSVAREAGTYCRVLGCDSTHLLAWRCHTWVITAALKHCNTTLTLSITELSSQVWLVSLVYVHLHAQRVPYNRRNKARAWRQLAVLYTWWWWWIIQCTIYVHYYTQDKLKPSYSIYVESQDSQLTMNFQCWQINC